MLKPHSHQSYHLSAHARFPFLTTLCGANIMSGESTQKQKQQNEVHSRALAEEKYWNLGNYLPRLSPIVYVAG